MRGTEHGGRNYLGCRKADPSPPFVPPLRDDWVRDDRAGLQGLKATPLLGLSSRLKPRPTKPKRADATHKERRTGRQLPVGMTPAFSTMRITVRWGARVRCTTPFGTTKPCLGASATVRPSRSIKS
jgi:hypothetical protein